MEAAKRAVLFEVCVESVEGAISAAVAGADRVELCAGLCVGGLTPSAGTVEAAREQLGIGLIVLLRPRAGDFLYSASELRVMERDLRHCREAGADGVAVGFLRPDGRVDLERTGELLELAHPLSITFHRAFDLCADPLEALEELAALGVHRVLTSGCERSVSEGLGLLRRLVLQAGERIGVMPGGGVREQDIGRILAESGAREIHFSAGAVVESQMLFRNLRCSLGSGAAPSEYERRITDPERVRRFLRAAGGARHPEHREGAGPAG